MSISHQQSDPFSRNKAEVRLNNLRKEKKSRELGWYRIKGDGNTDVIAALGECGVLIKEEVGGDDVLVVFVRICL